MTAYVDTLVLVVEDSDEDFDTVLEAAKRLSISHPIRRATNGDECLDVLRGTDAAPLHPAIVFLDLNTPGTDGREALAAIRSEPTLQALPVVILSTSANPKDVEHCYAYGANAYHVKPVRYTDHLALMHEVFSYWLKHVVLLHHNEVVC
jgi:CheY-like chemotaxis protein